MYDYTYPSNPLQISSQLPSNCEIRLDTTPVLHPYVARICPHVGYFLIWYTDPEKYPDITPIARKAKQEDKQSLSLADNNKIEYAQALVYPYEHEVIIGTVKYYNYMRVLGNNATRKLLKDVWKDIVNMFGDKKIICPTGSYFQALHFVLNQKKIPVSSYSDKIMKPSGFKHHKDYWIRDANILD
jgi:hypothetical protein